MQTGSQGDGAGALLFAAPTRASGRFPGGENPRQGEGSAGASGPGTLRSRGRSRAQAGLCGLVRVASSPEGPRKPLVGPGERGTSPQYATSSALERPTPLSPRLPLLLEGKPCPAGVCGHRGSGNCRKFGRKRPLRARGVGKGRHCTAPSGWGEQTQREASSTP